MFRQRNDLNLKIYITHNTTRLIKSNVEVG